MGMPTRVMPVAGGSAAAAADGGLRAIMIVAGDAGHECKAVELGMGGS